MDERFTLIARIEALAQELHQAERALNVQAIDSGLRERVRARFDKLIKQQRQALRIIAKEARNSQALDASWAAFDNIRLNCAPLFRECLAFMEGALSRSAGLDQGLCLIADALLDDLSRRADIPWQRFTILAEGEFLADMAEIIRLRFPELSIWNLPVAAHEFGHFVGPKLEEKRADGISRHPFQDILERERLIDPQYWHYLHEYFGDLFATYALGPAYACTCLLLRFDPRTAHQDGRAHPASAKRAYWVLKVLEKMDEAEGVLTPPYQATIKRLRHVWLQTLKSVGQSADLDPAAIVQLDAWLQELYLLVNDQVPGVRYDGWLRSQRLVAELDTDRDSSPDLRDEDRLSDVLNAAWQCRLQHWEEDSHLVVRRIGQKALKSCHEIAGRS